MCSINGGITDVGCGKHGHPVGDYRRGIIGTTHDDTAAKPPRRRRRTAGESGPANGRALQPVPSPGEPAEANTEDDPASAVGADAATAPDRQADVAVLAAAVNNRMRELGLTQFSASKLGFVSRSTLNLLGKEDRKPNRRTLQNLDDMLSWEHGSCEEILYGGQPTPRKARPRIAGEPVVPTPPDAGAGDDYLNLTDWIERRLKQLHMSRTRFAAIGGPSRSTLATMGKRGFQPTSETLEKIDTHLMWERGSALAALKGGTPQPLQTSERPHPALVPLSAIRDRINVLSARTRRQQEQLDQTLRDLDMTMEHVDLVVQDIEDTIWTSTATGTSAQDAAASSGAHNS